MSEAFDCQMTIVLPAVLEEEMLDLLRAQTAWVSGFSILHAEGFGAGARHLSTIEQVMGRSRRRLIQILMQREHVEPLQAAISARFQAPDMAWWLTPVVGFGGPAR
jgi:hypothetical protein